IFDQVDPNDEAAAFALRIALLFGLRREVPDAIELGTLLGEARLAVEAQRAVADVHLLRARLVAVVDDNLGIVDQRAVAGPEGAPPEAGRLVVKGGEGAFGAGLRPPLLHHRANQRRPAVAEARAEDAFHHLVDLDRHLPPPPFPSPWTKPARANRIVAG